MSGDIILTAMTAWVAGCLSGAYLSRLLSRWA